MKSDISLHKMNLSERIEYLKKINKLTDDDVKILSSGLPIDSANRMVENVIGTFSLPIGVATGFIVNGKDVLVPMVVEETSVIAAASNAAKLARIGGGFASKSDEPIMIGQIQLFGVPFKKTEEVLKENLSEMKKILNRPDSAMVKAGGGFIGVEVRPVKDYNVIHLLIDVRDAMGANAVNTMCEKISPYVEQWTGGKTGLKIISNLADYRIVRASATWKKTELGRSFNRDIKGEDAADAIISAWRFAEDDVYRCATHNKGIMNGIDAVLIATGNDWRAVEAGAHTYSRIKSKPLTWYEKNTEGDLVGHIEIPIVVGTVGGSTKINPSAQLSLRLLEIDTAKELAEIIACVGLANNFAALRALSMEGIQKGHMKLHATNIAQMAGAEGEQIDKISTKMIEEKKISVARAKEILSDMK
ncbi:MAG: hydroxymethylglutaryl-CoA reductase, degradative [Candidatus Aenigmatarchaeota archaeon]